MIKKKQKYIFILYIFNFKKENINIVDKKKLFDNQNHYYPAKVDK